ncbi:hypothetical protein ACN4EK_30315 [Pantanalinema rosaneae CENA516]|uniref:hypothetical protein n=1 Tax=Pantanalinema rosaneae TaxID=1620701 RepID=UPI003D6DCB9D
MVSPVLSRNWSPRFCSVRFSTVFCLSTMLAVSLNGIASDRSIAAEPMPSRKSDLVEDNSTVRAADLGDTLTITCNVITPLVQHPQCPIGGGIRPGESWFVVNQLAVAQDVHLMPYQIEPEPEQLTVINATF